MIHSCSILFHEAGQSVRHLVLLLLIWCLFAVSHVSAATHKQGLLFVYPEPRKAAVDILGVDDEYKPGLSLPPGVYEVKISHFGYREKRRVVVIEPGKSVDLFVELIKSKHIIDQETGMEFVWAPAGCFQMGCAPWAADCDPDESPAPRVCLSGFWISRFEVTQKVWKDVMGENPSRFQKGGAFPVEQVTWEQARAFAGKIMPEQEAVTARLPSEAQWEYAARSGGREEAFAGGDNPEALAWYRTNSRGSTQPVGEKQPNGLGLFDMSGNVWEWCRDAYDAEAYGHNQTVSRENVLFRVRRGGSWQSPRHKIRSLYRGRYPPDLALESNGLRLVLEPRKDSASKSSP